MIGSKELRPILDRERKNSWWWSLDIKETRFMSIYTVELAENCSCDLFMQVVSVTKIYV